MNAYVHLRGRSAELADFQYTSARTLLSIVRLSTALVNFFLNQARLRFADTVDLTDIDEALRLIECSKSSLVDEQVKRPQDTMSVIFNLIRDMCKKADGTLRSDISISEVRERIIHKGFAESDLQKCIGIYTDDDVWMVAGNGAKLRWMSVIEDSDEEL